MTNGIEPLNDETRHSDFVARLAESSFREQRARRRWSVFFRILFFGYVFAMTAWLLIDSGDNFMSEDTPHAAVVEISGVIVAGGDFDSLRINGALREAFETESAKGVILRINSPGGSPVESNRIYRELRRLRGLYPDKKIYAVAGDLCASGGYYVAAAADEVYVDDNSIIGSIGAVWAGFGFTGALEKIGVERRVRSAGGNKNMLDPFLPANSEDEARMDAILDSVHQTFIAAVREGRGARLSDEAEVFSGAVFSGARGIELGLADGIGDLGYVAREIIGVDDIVFYNGGDFLDSLIGRLQTKVAALLLHNTPAT